MVLKEGVATYGEAIGILMLDTEFPRIPGDIGNATTYPFPVRFKTVKGVYTKDIDFKSKDPYVAQRFIKAAKELQEEGVRAITTSCGYFVYFQDEIAEALDIPVFTSSLIQVPLITKMLGKNQIVGIICAQSKALTNVHLEKAGIDDSMVVDVVGVDEYWEDILTKMDSLERLDELEKVLIKRTEELAYRNTDLGAIVLECTNLPPGAAAVQKAVGLPVYDIVTLIYMMQNVTVRK
jgi:Asp/Glu/hydantoin racemase